MQKTIKAITIAVALTTVLANAHEATREEVAKDKTLTYAHYEEHYSWHIGELTAQLKKDSGPTLEEQCEKTVKEFIDSYKYKTYATASYLKDAFYSQYIETSMYDLKQSRLARLRGTHEEYARTYRNIKNCYLTAYEKVTGIEI